MRSIPQMEPWFDEKEADALHAYMKEGGWVTEFKKTKDFENAIKEFTGAKHCIVVNNGTISLTLALLAVGVGVGDEVIVPNYTMIATPNSAKLIGANPVFADIEAKTLCMDIESVKKKITKRTKAIMYVSLNGRTNDLGALSALAKQHGIALIEDAAQSLGSYYGDKHLGTIGAIGSFSFSAPKIISTGQGGALVTNDDDLAYKLGRLKDFGRASGGNDIHHSIGYNFKFTDLQAVIGLEQMKKLEFRMRRKKEIYERYTNSLSTVSQVEMIPTDLKHVSPWFIDIYIKDREKLGDYLKTKNIGTRIVYPPVHTQQAYAINERLPVSEDYCLRGLWLPSGANLTNEEIDHVTGSIREFYCK